MDFRSFLRKGCFLLLLFTVLSHIYFFQCKQTTKEEHQSVTCVIEPKNLAIVIPFTSKQIGEVTTSLKQWHKYRICHINGTASRYTSLIFYFHKDLQSYEQKNAFLRALQVLPYELLECFKEIKFVSAFLSTEEDFYPAGPSNQFYRLMLENRNFQAAYQVMFWMELDVQPIKSYWLEALYKEAVTGNFWMKGSIYRGEKIELSAATERWIPHINGNALYKVGDLDFNEVIRITQRKYSPDGNWNPFDACLYLYLHREQADFRLWQYAASKYMYSDFIYHYASWMTSENLDTARAHPRCFLVHGSNHSTAISAWNPRYRSKTLIKTEQ